jgi:hypothetical protein
MSATNGKSQSLRPMSKPAKQNACDKKPLTLRCLHPLFANLVYVLMLSGLGGAMTGCATTSPPSTPAALPAPPRLTEPLPSQSYSEKALQLIESLRQRVTGM